MQATARAHSNIAIVKYWGKRNEELMLPANSSLSMTIDAFYTTTTVTFDAELSIDAFTLNGKRASEQELLRVTKFLDHVRGLANIELRARVTSWNVVPKAVGVASSASGFAALAAAATRAAGLPFDAISLSRVARRGSGSACRSVYGGFVEWQKGNRSDGLDSHAIQIAPEDYWDLQMLIVLVSHAEKSISSREGMRIAAATSVFYDNWLDAAERDLETARHAISHRDFDALGDVAESNALRMHATTLGSTPPFTYFKPETLSVLQEVQALRHDGVPAFCTMDAGPNVVVLSEPQHAHRIRQRLKSVPGVFDVIICRPGPGVCYLHEANSEEVNISCDNASRTMDYPSELRENSSSRASTLS